MAYLIGASKGNVCAHRIDDSTPSDVLNRRNSLKNCWHNNAQFGPLVSQEMWNYFHFSCSSNMNMAHGRARLCLLLYWRRKKSLFAHSEQDESTVQQGIIKNWRLSWVFNVSVLIYKTNSSGKCILIILLGIL